MRLFFASLIQIHEPLGNLDSKDIKSIALLMVWRFLGKSIQQTLGGQTTLERRNGCAAVIGCVEKNAEMITVSFLEDDITLSWYVGYMDDGMTHK